MPDRKDHPKKVRIALRICEELEKRRSAEHYEGSFNSYVESLLSRFVDESYVPDGKKKLEEIQHALTAIRQFFEEGSRERVEVRGHRPARMTDERARKAG